jgi:glycosyltransferase involved in cell wall biosynthesis
LGVRFAARTASAITTQSGFMARLAASRGISARVVTHGVDLRSWPIRSPRRRIPGEPLRLLRVGGLTGVKDQRTLLEAMAILKQAGEDFELEVIGEGALAPQVFQATSDLDLDSVVSFKPVMGQAELRPRFERADLLIVTSIHESGPVVALEAAVAGVPSVGTQVGHVSDWAPDAANAVPVGDASALAEAIRALAHEESRRLRLAAAAQAIALREDADYTAGIMAEIYREVRGPRVRKVSERLEFSA